MSKEQRKVEWSLDLEHLKVRAGQMVSDVMGDTAETKTASLSETRDQAVTAKIEIAFSVGAGTALEALEPGSPKLFEAELTYVGEYEFDGGAAAPRRGLIAAAERRLGGRLQRDDGGWRVTCAGTSAWRGICPYI